MKVLPQYCLMFSRHKELLEIESTFFKMKFGFKFLNLIGLDSSLSQLSLKRIGDIVKSNLEALGSEQFGKELTSVVMTLKNGWRLRRLTLISDVGLISKTPAPVAPSFRLQKEDHENLNLLKAGKLNLVTLFVIVTKDSNQTDPNQTFIFEKGSHNSIESRPWNALQQAILKLTAAEANFHHHFNLYLLKSLK